MIKKTLENWIKETLSLEGKITLEHPADLMRGDFTFVSRSENPEEDFKKLEENKLPEVQKIELANGRFINIFLSKQFFTDLLKEILEKGEGYGKNNLLKREKIIIEYTDPNPFKEFHIGHLMPNVIGESLSRILDANGAEIRRANYQGDVGIHVACAVWGIIQKGGIIEGTNSEKIKYLGVAYSFGATILKENENLKFEIQELNKKLYEKSDEDLNKIYEWGRKISLEYFESLYKKLDTKFDFYFFESEVGGFGKEVVMEFLKKGVFEESDGAIVFKGENRDKKLHTRVFVNSQGLPVYEAKELGLSKIKYNKYPYTKSFIVAATEIDQYFKVLLAAMKEVFPDLAEKTKHISNGMLKLPTGKMSSRTGDVITFLELLSDVKSRILEKTNNEEIAEQVSLAAIKYTILRQSVGGDIIFDFEKSISFEGDSGPYLQYTAVRANAVLKTAYRGAASVNITRVTLGITEVEKLLYRFPEIVERSAEDYSPHHLVNYLIELAGSFNSFYAQNKIIDETNPDLSAYRLTLTKAVSIVLTNGLYLLGIKVPERM